MKFNGFIGPTYKLNSVNVDCQRAVNIYPEVVESGTGKEGQVSYFKSTPGLKELMNIGPGPIRLIHPMQISKRDPLIPNNRVVIVSGNKVFGATLTAGVWSTAEVGTLETSTGIVVCENSGYVEGALSKGFSATLADGTKGYTYFIGINVPTGTLAETINPFPPIYDDIKPTHVVLIDGFFIYNTIDTGNFHTSLWNQPSFINAAEFASSEGDPDNLVAMIAKNRELWLFNERSTEVWYNTGNADFPFERVQGGFIEQGCVARYSPAKIDGLVFWLGRDRFGQGSVYIAQGLSPQRISTHAVEEAIRGYSDISKAIGYTYSQDGHSFYVLNFPEGTWVYDLSTKLWHERAYTNKGELERHRGDCLAFFPEGSMHLVGDYQNGKIYQLDSKTYSDAGNPITRMRVAPHVSGHLNRVFFKTLQIDMETGVGLDGDVQGSDPQAMLDWSDDGGHTWSSEHWATIGKKIGGIGDFKKRLIWRRLGSSRDRVFRLKITDPVPVTILSAEMDLEVGAS